MMNYGSMAATLKAKPNGKRSEEPRPKKASQVRLNVKVLLTVFFDCNGVKHHEFLPQGRTFNKEYVLIAQSNSLEMHRIIEKPVMVLLAIPKSAFQKCSEYYI